MSRAAVEPISGKFAPVLSVFETTFIQTVLEHRRVFERPTLAEFSAALDVLRRYDEQCLDNPGWGSEWVPQADQETLIALKAKAFLLFGVTKPSRDQWHRAHKALFGPLLCETCG